MSKLLKLIEENPSSARKFIGISYDGYREFLKDTSDFPSNQAVEYFPKLNFTARVKNYIQRLIKEPKYSSVFDEFALIPDEIQKSSELSYSDKILLILFCLNQNWTKEMANQIGVCEASVLSFYFNTTEAVISEVFYYPMPLLQQLSSKGLLKVDLAEACSRILNASTFFYEAQFKLKLLKSLGFSPSCIYDIGAAAGSWTQAVHYVFPNADFHLFEPLEPFVPDYKLRLEWLGQGVKEYAGQEIKYTVYPFSLGEKIGTSNIAIGKDASASSMLLDKGKDDENFPSTQEISVFTLDSVVEQQQLPYAQLIKMDTQGYELNILKGAEEALKHAEVLVLETWLTRGYGPKTPLFLEIATWLAHRGFVLFDFGGTYRDASGILISPDCYFVNRLSPLFNNGNDRCIDLDLIQRMAL